MSRADLEEESTLCLYERCFDFVLEMFCTFDMEAPGDLKLHTTAAGPRLRVIKGQKGVALTCRKC